MIELAIPIRKSVERLSQFPVVFDWLRWILEAGFENHRRLIARNFPILPAQLLDCGCGTGIFATCFSSTIYTGIDLSSKYIDRARKCNPNYRFEVMDAMSLDFANETFDAVIVSGVLHHLPTLESRRLLGEVFRVMRPGGRLLMWEDIPTVSRLNLIGHLVHSLDVGEHIRQPESYQELLSPQFELEHIEPMRSGFMDYITLTARKPVRSSAPTANQLPSIHEIELSQTMN
jgi:SAM-dependent methyltransferase